MTDHELLLAALSLDPAERGPFLDDACAGDSALRQRIDELLVRFTEAAKAPDPPTAAYQPPSEGVGTIIAGRYKLLEQIGEGGMGAVWVAEQTEPVRRKVALKLIKAGMDSKAVLARFEAERQALAMMDHPNIAKVLDGGKTESGRPYFAMELVKGVPFTTYCDDARLTIARRLELFVPVCQAVQHAHQKGIIHRDLKPSNILVCLYDGKPVPKVIDFGLAKAMHQPLTDLTLHTALGAMMGTPLYMSPEQAEFNNLDVDTRTDIYSLGVILYELLTGTTPLERKRFKDAAWQEMVRLIKEEEPPKPSARLSGSNTLPSAAAQRQLEPIKLTRLVRGELDWIVMKALEKERSRRYETANGLARDLEAFLADDPVEASPPSARYKLGKFARKHRAGLAMAATVVFLLVTGIATSTWQAIRATLAEDEATTLAVDAKESEREVKKQAEIAKSQTAIAKTNEEAAKKSAEDLRYNLALDRILLAQAAFDRGNVAEANERLAEVPKELRRWEWNYLKRQFEGGIFTLDHGGSVNSVAFSPDGTRLVTGSADNTAKVWDARTGKHLLDLKGWHTGGLTSVGFSPDGTRLVTGGGDNTAKVWDARTGAHLLDLKGWHTSWVNSVAFSPDGTRIATGSADQTAKIWDARTGKHLLDLKGWHTSWVNSVAFSPDGTRIATGSADQTAKVWDARTGAHLLDLKGHSQTVISVAFSPDGTRLVTGSMDNTAKVWDARTGAHLLDLKGHTDQVFSVAFSPDGTRLVTGSLDNTAKVWDARTGAHLLDLKGHFQAVNSVAFSPDGTRIATGSWDTMAKVWDARTATPPPLLDLKGHTGLVTSVAFSPDGTRLVTGSMDNTAKVWDARTGAHLLDLKGHADLVNSVAFSPDGTRIATGSADQTAKVWDARTGAHLLDLKGHSQAVISVAVSPDGTRLVTGSNDNTAKVWDARTGTHLLDLNKGYTSSVNSVAFSPDGTRLVTGSNDNAADVWDARTGTHLLDLDGGHTGSVNSVAFSPDGTRLVTGSIDYAADVRDARTGTHLLDLNGGHTGLVNSVAFSVAFSPDGTRLVTGSNDNAAKIWDSQTGTPLLELKGHGITSVAFSPDDTRLAMAVGFTALVYGARSGKALVDQKGEIDAQERAYRLYCTRPRPDIHRAELAKAIKAKDTFAAKFHLDHLLSSIDPESLSAKDYLDVDYHTRPRAAAQLFAKIFAFNPPLSGDLENQNRYNGARYAALAAAGKGEDAAKLDDTERAGLRKQALDWLRADLAAYVKMRAGGAADKQKLVGERLRHWQTDADFAGIRDEAALGKLPAAEREDWRRLWAEVARLVSRDANAERGE